MLCGICRKMNSASSQPWKWALKMWVHVSTFFGTNQEGFELLDDSCLFGFYKGAMLQVKILLQETHLSGFPSGSNGTNGWICICCSMRLCRQSLLIELLVSSMSPIFSFPSFWQAQVSLNAVTHQFFSLNLFGTCRLLLASTAHSFFHCQRGMKHSRSFKRMLFLLLSLKDFRVQ